MPSNSAILLSELASQLSANTLRSYHSIAHKFPVTIWESFRLSNNPVCCIRSCFRICVHGIRQFIPLQECQASPCDTVVSEIWTFTTTSTAVCMCLLNAHKV